MPARSREHLIEKAFYPVSPRQGTPYPCRQRDLDSIREPSKRNHGPFVNQRQVTRELVQHNDLRRRPSSHEREAMLRLSDAVYDAGRHPWGPDLVIKSFLDLDIVFFGGALRGYVGVSWEHRDCFNDDGESQGRTTGTAEAVVILNAEATLMAPDPFKEMFSAMLHEMCHTFEIVRTGSYDNPYPNTDGHGVEFGTRVYAVHRRAKELFGLEAISPGESWPRYHVGGHSH